MLQKEVIATNSTQTCVKLPYFIENRTEIVFIIQSLNSHREVSASIVSREIVDLQGLLISFLRDWDTVDAKLGVLMTQTKWLDLMIVGRDISNCDEWARRTVLMLVAFSGPLRSGARLTKEIWSVGRRL